MSWKLERARCWYSAMGGLTVCAVVGAARVASARHAAASMTLAGRGCRTRLCDETAGMGPHWVITSRLTVAGEPSVPTCSSSVRAPTAAAGEIGCSKSTTAAGALPAPSARRLGPPAGAGGAAGLGEVVYTTSESGAVRTDSIAQPVATRIGPTPSIDTPTDAALLAVSATVAWSV